MNNIIKPWVTHHFSSMCYTHVKSMNVSKDGEKEILISLNDWKNIRVIETNNQSVPDIDKSNNILLLNK